MLFRSSLPLVGALLSLQWLWLSLFIFGFTLATQDVAMNAHAVLLEQQAGRRLMSVFHAMFSVGTLAGSFFGGAMSQWKITPLFQSLLLLFIIALLALFLRPMFMPATADQHPIEKNAGHRQPLIFWILGFFGLCAALSEGAAGDWEIGRAHV